MLEHILIAATFFVLYRSLVFFGFIKNDSPVTTAQYQRQFQGAIYLCILVGALAAVSQSLIGAFYSAAFAVMAVTNYWMYRQSQHWGN